MGWDRKIIASVSEGIEYVTDVLCKDATLKFSLDNNVIFRYLSN